MYSPKAELTIDKSLVKYRGRVAFRQYMPAKPIKWGIKVWALYKATTGYLLRFQIYTGHVNGRPKVRLADRVVKDLVQGLHHHVYMDNFYSNPQLFHELRVFGTYSCGSVRKNRKGIPKELVEDKMQRHQYKLAQKNLLTFCAWQDTKPVLFLSSFHNPQKTGKVNHRVERQKQGITVPA